MQGCPPPPTPPPPPSSPPPVPRFQIHWTTILFWALRAKHLLRFVSQNFSSPRGIYGSQGSNSCRYVVELASSRCLFPLPKGFRMQRTEGIEKTYLNSSYGGQPISQSSFSVFLLYNSQMQVFCLLFFSFFCSPPPFKITNRIIIVVNSFWYLFFFEAFYLLNK